jgi:hypothetical protein
VTHLTQSQLQDFVVGIAEPKEAEALRAHVAICQACAVRLQDEARFDLSLQDVAGLAIPVPVGKAESRHWMVPRPAWVGALLLTVTVGFWLYLSRYQPAPISAEDTYAPRDYCLFVGGQVDRIGLQAEFPDTALNQADVRH